MSESTNATHKRMRETKQEIDNEQQEEFAHGFQNIYNSDLETKIRLSFDFYDFDQDLYIKKEDVHLILSYIPIENIVMAKQT